MHQQIDRQRAQEFAGKLMGLYTGGILSLMLVGRNGETISHVYDIASALL